MSTVDKQIQHWLLYVVDLDIDAYSEFSLKLSFNHFNRDLDMDWKTLWTTIENNYDKYTNFLQILMEENYVTL